MPTQWYNFKRSEIYLFQVEKSAAWPTYVRVHNRGGVSGGDDVDKRSGRSAPLLRRGTKISKLRRLIETAARHRAGAETCKRKGITVPQVSHHAPQVITRKAPKKIEGTSATDDVLKEEAKIEVEVEEAKAGLGLIADDATDSDDDGNDETVYYSIKDEGSGSSSSSKPLPPALTHIQKIAKKIFRGERSYTRVVLEEGRVESNRELVHQLNQLVIKKLPHVLDKLREERKTLAREVQRMCSPSTPSIKRPLYLFLMITCWSSLKTCLFN